MERQPPAKHHAHGDELAVVPEKLQQLVRLLLLCSRHLLKFANEFRVKRDLIIVDDDLGLRDQMARFREDLDRLLLRRGGGGFAIR